MDGGFDSGPSLRADAAKVRLPRWSTVACPTKLYARVLILFLRTREVSRVLRAEQRATGSDATQLTKAALSPS